MTDVPGRKDDSGKLDITLLFDDLPHALEAVTEVLQWATTKKEPTPYVRGSWQGVAPFQPRYRAAMLRHMLDSAKQKVTLGVPIENARDAETQLLHLAHIATDALFQLEMSIRELNKKRTILVSSNAPIKCTEVAQDHVCSTCKHDVVAGQLPHPNACTGCRSNSKWESRNA